MVTVSSVVFCAAVSASVVTGAVVVSSTLLDELLSAFDSDDPFEPHAPIIRLPVTNIIATIAAMILSRFIVVLPPHNTRLYI